MIPAVLDELDGIVDLDDVVVLVATGTHRGNTEAELRAMFGDEVVDSRPGRQPRRPRPTRSLAGSARSATACPSGSTASGSTPTSGSRPASSSRTSSPASPAGRRWSRPGSPALETVLVLHDATRIGDPRATWGVTDGNPVHDDVRAIAAATGVDLRARRGPQPRPADRRGVRRRPARRCTPPRRAAARGWRCGPSPAPFDVVVTTNSGYPARPEPLPGGEGHVGGADQVVRPGGTIVCAAECRDGFPDHGSYREVLASAAVARRRCSTTIAARERRPCPTSGRSRSRPASSPPAGSSCTRPPDRRRARRRPPGADRRHLRDGRPRARRRRARRARVRAAGRAADDPLPGGRSAVTGVPSTGRERHVVGDRPRSAGRAPPLAGGPGPFVLRRHRVICVIDPVTGLGGDMLLAALLRTSARLRAARVRAAISSTGLTGWRLTAERITDHGLSATLVRVEVAGTRTGRRPAELVAFGLPRHPGARGLARRGRGVRDRRGGGQVARHGSR